MSKTVDYKNAIPGWSPNYWEGRSDYPVTHICIHGTGGLMPGCLDWLCDQRSQASVHYLVARDGKVYQLVNENDASWGNGLIEPGSPFVGQVNPNLWTISVEHERDENNTSPITVKQRAASVALISDIRKRRGPLKLIPHSMISPLSRAQCPGPGFPLDEIDKASAKQPAIVWVKFDARAHHVPLPFYDHPSLGADELYVSKARRGDTVHFDGWARGQDVIDPQNGQLDDRWYHRADPAHGWCPSAYVDGNAPNSTPQ